MASGGWRVASRKNTEDPLPTSQTLLAARRIVKDYLIDGTAESMDCHLNVIVEKRRIYETETLLSTF